MIERQLVSAGFRYESYVLDSKVGYQAAFHDAEGNTVWVFVSLPEEELRIYKELDCGGELARMETSIPHGLVQDDEPDAFFGWLDDETSFYLG